jgi:hypothetical protein
MPLGVALRGFRRVVLHGIQPLSQKRRVFRSELQERAAQPHGPCRLVRKSLHMLYKRRKLHTGRKGRQLFDDDIASAGENAASNLQGRVTWLYGARYYSPANDPTAVSAGVAPTTARCQQEQFVIDDYLLDG